MYALALEKDSGNVCGWPTVAATVSFRVLFYWPQRLIRTVTRCFTSDSCTFLVGCGFGSMRQ